MTTITAVTAQDTKGVHEIYPVPPKIVSRQIELALKDIGADAIKIGMLATPEIAKAVASSLEKYARRIPIVLDPVMIAKDGARLLAGSAVRVLKEKLLPLAMLVTPNIPEARALAGMKSTRRADIEGAGRRLMAMGAKAALIKGGHASKATVDDVLVWQGGVDIFAFPRVRTKCTHGTGCTLSTAIACGLAQGLSLPLAVGRAREFVQAAIETAPGFGHGHGPLNHMHALQRRD